MAETSETPSLLDTLGEEIIRIITPVSTCMLLVVLLVTTLESSGSPLTSIATIAYPEAASDSTWDKVKDALLNSLVFVAVITALTFFLVFLFYIRCTKCLKYYMAFSSFVVLSFMGGEILLLLISHFDIPIDSVSFVVLLFNFSVVGVMAVFMSKVPIVVTQAYLVVIGVLVAYWFTLLPEWTTWALLVAMALYDLAAVLLPGGPLRLLVELAISRDEEIPALVYEARPIESQPGERRGLWRRSHSHSDSNANPVANSNASAVPATVSSATEARLITPPSEDSDTPVIAGTLGETRLVIAEEESSRGSTVPQLTAPLIQRRLERDEEDDVDGIGLGSSGAIKLGLGDFIFYSVLVGRAALYDFMTVYACYLAIIAGLGVTLMLLAFYRKALPALPVSVLLGVLFYALTRMFLELFVVQCSINLLMF